MIDCINKEDNLINYAIELGLSGVAITDHESLGGHIKALQHYKKLQDKAKDILDKNDQEKEDWAKKVLNFKLGLGNEIYLCRDDLNKNNYIKGEDGFFHFILVAKDKIGHKQLRELSSRAWNHTFRQFMERVPTYYRDIEEIVYPNKGHLIATTACLGGQFPKLLMEAIEKNNFSKVNNFMNWCREMFEDDFYIEIQPGLSEDQVSFNSAAIAYANQYGFKYIVSTDTHYLKETDRPIHKSFLNSGEGDREVDDFYAYTYMMPYEEIVEKLSTHMSKESAIEALENTKEIYSKVEFYDLAHKQIIPRVPYNWESIEVFKTAPSKYPYIQKFMDSPYEDDRFFISSILFKGNKLGILDEIHWKRIEDECGEIWEVSEKIEERLSAYFLTIQKIVDIGWNEGDTLMGPWRGSAGALLTAYLLDITQRDPLESPIELPYWRCISRGRAELADFDLDSQASKRERFIAAIKVFFESIGGQVISVCTYGTETSKAALLTAARGLGYEPELGTYLSSLIPIDRGFVRTLSQCYYGDEEKGYKPIKQFITEMTIHKDIWEVAKGIEGLISRRGIHAAGILITNNEFTEFNATMRSPKGVLTSQWELHDSEYVGKRKNCPKTVNDLSITFVRL
jgi:DNA polymerase-3 subunit alpha